MLLALSTLGASAWAQNTPVNDPLEPLNRRIYTFNEYADRYVLRPVAQAYDDVAPEPVQTGVRNFFDNLGEPISAVNNLLQGEFGQAGHNAGRFLMNSTLGVFGLTDPASAAGLEPAEEDFGQTLAVWGLPSGWYLVLPLLGPTTVRDGAGTLVDLQFDPLHYLDDDELRWALRIAQVISLRADLLGADQVLESAYDRYSFSRDAYLQRRHYQRYDGEPPMDDFEDEYGAPPPWASEPQQLPEPVSGQ